MVLDDIGWYWMVLDCIELDDIILYWIGWYYLIYATLRDTRLD